MCSIYCSLLQLPYTVEMQLQSQWTPQVACRKSNWHNDCRSCCQLYTSVTWWCHQIDNIFRVTAHLHGEFTGPAQRPVTRSFDVFFDLHLNKRLSKHSWGWWFETSSCPLWCHCNAARVPYHFTDGYLVFVFANVAVVIATVIVAFVNQQHGW